MSYIFDALQRSEMEREGTKTSLTDSALAVATDLLEAAERKRRSNGTTGTAVAERPEPSDFLNQMPSLPVSLSPNSRLVAIGQEESLGAEKFRFLAVRLRQLRQSRTMKKVLITSTIPQEGKSTVAANLACTLARRQRTLLLDGDTRRPALTRIFGLEGRPGLCDLLRGGSEATESIYHLEGPGFWMLPAGRVEGNPLELLQSGKLSKL